MDWKQHEFPATSRPMQLFWLAQACFWTVRLVQHGIVWHQGTPTPPWDRPVPEMLMSGGSLLLALSFLVRRFAPRMVLVAGALVAMGINFGFAS